MDKEKFNRLKNIRKSFFEQGKGFCNSKNNLIELYNFNEIKKEIAKEDLSIIFINYFAGAFYVCILYVFEFQYNYTDVELVIPIFNAIVEVLTIIINSNIDDMGYNEDDLLSKSILNRSTISLLKKYLKLSKQNKSIGEKIKTFNKGIEMTEELYQKTTNDIIDTMCDIDKELFDYEKFILETYKYKDESPSNLASKAKDCVKTYGGVKQSTIDVLNKYGLL